MPKDKRMTAQQELRNLDTVVTEIAGQMRQFVTQIEDGVAITRNHYGDYMNILTTFTDDMDQRRILARALIEAGANGQGVADALRAVT